MWTGVGALVAIAALGVAILQLTAEPGGGTPATPAPLTPAPVTQAPAGPGTTGTQYGDILCGIGGVGHQNGEVECDLGARDREQPAARGPVEALAGPPPTHPHREPGTAPETATPVRPTPQPAKTQPTTPVPQRTTPKPPPPEPPPAGIVTTAWPTFVAVDDGGGAVAVDSPSAADFQVEARQVAPLHGTRILRTDGPCAYSPAYTDGGLGFEPADGARFCLRTRLGDLVVLRIEPSRTADSRPYPFTVRVGPA